MKLLLDTHTFLWLVEGSPTLSAAARTGLADRANDLFLSVGSVWELAIKIGTFVMGSHTDEQGRRDEGPRHPVTARPFWMGQMGRTSLQRSGKGAWCQTASGTEGPGERTSGLVSVNRTLAVH